MDDTYEFQPFEKIARLKRELVITEKLDGTNAHVCIGPIPEGIQASYEYVLDIRDGMALLAGSRKRWIAPEGTLWDHGSCKDDEPNKKLKGTDNFGFALWVTENLDELWKLGEGRHYGEWYGKGIQRGYGLEDKRFALFNVARWGSHNPNTPACCEVVPLMPDSDPDDAMANLHHFGSAVGGPDHVFMDPEGIVVYHTASRTLYKQTFDQDGGKWREETEVERWAANGAFDDKPTPEAVQEAIDEPIKQGMAEYGA